MFTKNVNLIRKWDYTEHMSCENCGRTKDLKRIFSKNGNKCKEMCFCQNCWSELMKEVNNEVIN